MQSRELYNLKKKEWRDNNKDRNCAIRNKSYHLNKHKHVEKVAAHSAVAEALRTGEIERSSYCEDCGSQGMIEAHHDDYSRKLNVRWLCLPCHSEAHRMPLPDPPQPEREKP